MLFNKASNIIITFFAIFVFSMAAASNLWAQDIQMAQQKEEVTAFSDDSGSVQQEVVYPDLPAESATIENDDSRFDIMLGLGFTNFYSLPGYVGASYQFSDFYWMSIDIKLGLLLEFMLSANWMHMFEFYGNEYISLSAGAGIGYLAVDSITLRLDGPYEEDDDDWHGKKGIVFPAAFAFDWHTSKTVSLRAQLDLNNYLVLEDKRENKCKVPRYEFHYDVIFQAVIHI